MHDVLLFFGGVAVGQFILSLFVLAKRARPRPPSPPRTAAQLANESVYEADKAHHPVVASMRVQRRPRRQVRWQKVEDNPFDNS
jgi:hypothetical protein